MSKSAAKMRLASGDDVSTVPHVLVLPDGSRGISPTGDIAFAILVVHAARNLQPQSHLRPPSLLEMIQSAESQSLVKAKAGGKQIDTQAIKSRSQFRRCFTMEALRGVRSLRSTAARAAQLQQRRRQVSTQPAKYVKDNADTTKMSSGEAAKLGAAKKPPGSNKGSGTFMHQQSNLDTKNSKYLQPWLFPIYPMLGMVAIAVSLGLMTAYRELVINPGVLLDKSKRTEELPELHEKEWAMKMSRRYAEGSPMRSVSAEHRISPFGRHLDEDIKEGSAIQIGRRAMGLSGEPPRLPGDDKPVHGPAGTPRPLGGNN